MIPLRLKELEERVEIIWSITVEPIIGGCIHWGWKDWLNAEALDEQPGEMPQIKSLEEAKVEHVRKALEACGFNKMKTARCLKINVKTLYNLLRKWGYTGNDDE